VLDVLQLAEYPELSVKDPEKNPRIVKRASSSGLKTRRVIGLYPLGPIDTPLHMKVVGHFEPCNFVINYTRLEFR
jgi:hypothetical protein